jgi:hypothetical protein
MPNWCLNNLHVEGDLNALQDFKKRVLVQSDENDEILTFTMERLMPTPKELLEMTAPVMWRGDENDTDGKLEFEKTVSELKEKYGYTDWYDWRVDNWGTKWDAAESYILDDEDKFLNIEYNTAWGPNIEWVRFAAKVYPSLKFKLLFEEPGCNFCGIYEVTGDDEDLMESDLEWIDPDTDRKVSYDSEIERYRFVDTNEIIDDEDFYPDEFNPFSN